MPFKDTELELERIRQLSRDRQKRFRENKKDLKFYIDHELYDEIKEYCLKADTSIRQLMLNAVREYMKAHPVKSES